MTPRPPINEVQKIWGSETWFVNNDKYCGKALFFKKGRSGSLHFHKNKYETFHLYFGKVKIQIADCIYDLLEGENIDIPANVSHRVTAEEDSLLIEFSTPHDDDDTYRIELSK